MADEAIQLDLTTSISEVPQANNLSLFVRLMEAIHRGVHTVSELAEVLEIESRTVEYYVDFGRWLHMLRAASPGRVALTETGATFAESVPARGRLFAQAMFGRKLVGLVNSLKRDSTDSDDVETLDTRTACLEAIRATTELAEATAKRRAQGLASMLEAAYRPSRIDWNTGQTSPEAERVRFEFKGRTFLTAMAARQFGTTREFRIGFPRQVRRFVEGHGHGASARIFDAASFESADGKAVWFGAIPVDATTIEVAERGGPDLRKLVTACSPYVALAAAILSYRDAASRRCIRLTHDMYGLRLWDHERELGPPRLVIEQLAEALELTCIRGVPAPLSAAEPELVEPGDDDDLVAVLRATGIVTSEDTTFELTRGFDAELREAAQDTPSILERLAPMHEKLRILLARR